MLPVVEDQIDNMLALSVRQPWVELILYGIKTIEVRSRPTRIRGRVLLYSSLKAADQPPSTEASSRLHSCHSELETGLLLGSVEIVDCRELVEADTVSTCLSEIPSGKHFAWVLRGPRRLSPVLKPSRHPQPVFFRPFEGASR